MEFTYWDERVNPGNGAKRWKHFGAPRAQPAPRVQTIWGKDISGSRPVGCPWGPEVRAREGRPVASGRTDSGHRASRTSAIRNRGTRARAVRSPPAAGAAGP